MAGTDRTSIHAILGRAIKTISRAIHVAECAEEDAVMWDLITVRDVLYRVQESTRPAALPEADPPGRCA